jgi:hypothetical protein
VPGVVRNPRAIRNAPSAQTFRRTSNQAKGQP